MNARRVSMPGYFPTPMHNYHHSNQQAPNSQPFQSFPSSRQHCRQHINPAPSLPEEPIRLWSQDCEMFDEGYLEPEVAEKTRNVDASNQQIFPSNKHLMNVKSSPNKRHSLPANFSPGREQKFMFNTFKHSAVSVGQSFEVSGNRYVYAEQKSEFEFDQNGTNGLRAKFVSSTAENGSMGTVFRETVTRTPKLVGRSLTHTPSSVKKRHQTQNSIREPTSFRLSNKQSFKKVKNVKESDTKRRINIWEKIKRCTYFFFQIGMLVNVVLLIMISYKSVSTVICGKNLMFNTTQLGYTLSQKVFGQHIAVDTIPTLIENHLHNENKKTLVLSFHGWTGIGKNYVSGIIGDHITTKTVHKLIVPLHFPHKGEAGIYGDQLLQWVIGNISTCTVNLVILDEVDKASWHILPALERLLTQLHDLDFNNTKVIVLLLSNTGGSTINKYVLDEIMNGRPRQSLTQADLVKTLLNPNLYAHSWHLTLNHKKLVDAYIPFMPLEKTHIRKCVEQAIYDEDERLDAELVSRVAEQLSYFPPDMPVFSRTGCRKVTSKLHLEVQ